MMPLVEIIANMFYSGLAIHFMNLFLGEKARASGRGKLLGWTAYFLTVTFPFYPKGSEEIGAVCCGLVLFLYAVFALNGGLAHKLTAAVLWNLILLVSSRAALVTVNLVSCCGTAEVKEAEAAIGIGGRISVFLVRMLLIRLAVMLRQKRKDPALLSRRLAAAVCLFYLFMWINVVGILAVELHADDKDRVLYILLLLLVLMAGILFLFRQNEKWSLQERTKNLYLERMNMEQQKYIHDLLKSNEETKILKHDLKRYLYVIGTFVYSGEYEECKRYLQKLLEGCDSIVTSEAECGILQILLENRKSACGKESIAFHYSMMANWQGLDEMDLGVLLLNLMDNAVEAERKETVKEIALEITNYKGYLKIACRNRISKSVLEKNQGRLLLTGKTDKERHGIGLLSIDKIVQKHDGFQQITEENGYFVNTVYLRNG